MLHQVSIFAANTKGALSRITSILARNDINIYTMLATDSAEFALSDSLWISPTKPVKRWKKKAISAG